MTDGYAFQVTQRPIEESFDELFHHASFTPEEIARLLNISVVTIEQQAFAGDLEAEIVEHHVVSIRRDALLRWLRENHLR